jgi:hypothetical protein
MADRNLEEAGAFDLDLGGLARIEAELDGNETVRGGGVCVCGLRVDVVCAGSI